MRKLRDKINNLSIRKKMIFYSYLIIIPILLIACIIIGIQRYNELLADIRERGTSNVSTLADNIQLITADVSEFSNYIMINDEVLSLLKTNQAAELNKDSRLWQNQTPVGMVEDMMELKGYIKSIAIYPENEVKPYLRSIDSTSFVDSAEMVRRSDYYQRAIEKRGKSSWSYVPRSDRELYFSSRSDQIVLYRELFDLTKKKPMAFLAIGISAETMEGVCDNFLFDEGESISILNGENEEIVVRGTMDENISRRVKELSFTQIEQQVSYTQSYQNHMIFLYRKDELSPTICKVFAEPGVMEVIDEIILIPLLLLLGVLLGLFPVVIIVSNIITKPLAKVQVAMANFKQGDFEQQLEVRTGDEIGEVANGFNQMVTDLKELINRNYIMALRERESELTALQAQINPHFLYNTLDTIYWKASDEGNEEIAENIYSLSQLFRLVLGKGTGEVPVKMEIDLVKHYLEIQKMRFGDRLEYEITVDEKIDNEQIPKLILQPFVENAAVHGVGNSEHTGWIYITGKASEERLYFTVRDTGVGMSEDQIEKIWKEGEDVAGSSYKIGRYAIYNVLQRLELKYGEDFLLEIESREGQGTQVTIEIPRQGV